MSATTCWNCETRSDGEWGWECPQCNEVTLGERDAACRDLATERARAEALEKAARALIASEFCRTGAGDPMVGAAEFESLRALTRGDAADERSGA
jgi:predicted RNA-binding Zn-ribbon protein involved in translation (DUF1610 family)